MKQKFLYIIVALLSLAGLTACDGAMELPPMVVPTFELPSDAHLMTIMDFKQAYWQNTNNYATLIPQTDDGQDIYIKGRVISSDATGNIFKNLYIEDETAGICFSINSYDLYQTFYYGQELYVKMTGLYAGRYSALFEAGIESGTSIGRIDLDVFNEYAHMNVKLPAPALEPLVTTPTDLAAIKSQTAGLQEWQCRLIQLNNVYFENAGQEFAPTANSNRYIVDENGGRLNVYCSTYSDFKNDIIPKGYGTVIGVLSYYNNDWQLLLNSLDDLVDFDGADTPGAGGATGDAIFTQAFKSDGQGKFIIQNVTKPESVAEVWKYDSKYGMVATGYADNTNYATDSWLISPVFDLASVTGAQMTFRHALNYFASLAEAKVQATVWVSANGGNWQQLQGVTYPEALGWSFVDAGVIDLSAYDGKKIQIAFRYISTSAKAGTWEVDNFQLLGKGTVSVSDAQTPGGTDAQPAAPESGSEEVVTGKGSASEPYTVAEVIAGAKGSGVWVMGYIVGTNTNKTWPDDCEFGTTNASNTNLMLAPSADCKDAKQCIPVQLPADLRDALSLQKVPGNLGKQVCIKGNLETYFSVPGLKSTTAYNWGATGAQ